MHAEEESLQFAERQMAEYELEAISALFAKLARRLGLDNDHPTSERRLQMALSDLIDEDPEAAELARTLIVLRKGRGEE
jgi:hypothetical protein